MIAGPVGRGTVLVHCHLCRSRLACPEGARFEDFMTSAGWRSGFLPGRNRHGQSRPGQPTYADLCPLHPDKEFLP